VHRKSFFTLATVVGLIVSALAVGSSSKNATAWPFPNTRALVFSGFPGDIEGAYGGKTMSDADDNIVVLSTTGGTVQVDPTNPSTVVGNGRDWTQLLAKYSPRGELVWNFSWTDLWGEFVLWDTAITPTGDIIVVGDVYVAGADVDPSSATSIVTNANSGIIMKFSAGGSVVWVRELSSTTSASAMRVRLTPTGNIVVGGNFEGTMNLDSAGGPGGLTFTSSGRTDFFVASFDSSGVEQWAVTGSSSDPDYVADLELSASGDIFMFTDFRDTMTLRSASGAITTVSPLISGTTVPLVWKLTASGNSVWTTRPTAGTGTHEVAEHLVVQGNGELVLTLNTNHLLSLSSTGTVSSAMQTAGDIRDVEQLSSGVIAIGGAFQNTVDLDPTAGIDNYTSIDPANDGFVTLLSSSLGYLSTRVYSAIGSNEITDIAVDNDGGWIVTGWTLVSSPLSLSTTSESATFNAAAGADSMNFIVRYQADGSTAVPIPSAPTSASYAPGNKKATLQWETMSHAARYVVKNAAGAIVCDTTTTSCDVTGLRNGRFGTFTITAYNYLNVASASSTSVNAMGGFLVKTTSWKVRSKPRLSSIVTTPSKGAKTWRVTSGACRVGGKKIVMPTKKGRCTLQLSVSRKKPYPKMSTKVIITVSK
jgi:hypothetical protein